MALLQLRVIEDHLVVLLNLGVIEGHVQLPIEILKGVVRANQLAF